MSILTSGQTRKGLRPPGPSRRHAMTLLYRMNKNRITVLHEAALTYGDASRIPLGPKTLYLFNHPDHAKYVLADNPLNFHKGIGLQHARKVIGDGLLTSEGDRWKAQRKVIQPVFQAKRINAQLGAVADEAETLVKRLRSQTGRGVVDIRQTMTDLTLGVLGRTLLDADLSAFGTIGEDFEAVQTQAMFEMMTLNAVPTWAPFPMHKRFRAARRHLDHVVARLSSDRRAHPSADGDDVVSRLIEYTENVPDRTAALGTMRDDLVTLLLAGHETTAATLTWAFYLIDRHPEVRERLHKEATEVLSGDTVTLADLHKLTYTTQVLEEVMRMYPPVWLLPRIAQEEDEIGGYHVPAGADVLICPYTLQRHPDFWPEPDRFDPERFAPGKAASRSRYAYIPFGAGPRFCVGNTLGMMEATIVLATVARDLRLTAGPGFRADGEPMLTLRIRGGLPMSVHAA